MPRTGRPKPALSLTDDEREQLVRWSRRAKSAQALALRSRIVLACADGADNKTVAVRLGCAEATVAEVASPVRGAAIGGAGGRAATGGAAQYQR